MIVYAYTPLIRTSDLRYPVYLSDFRSDNPNVSIGSWIYSENLVEFGYFPVIPKDMPTGDVVTEVAPTFNEETQQWEQTWEVRDFTPEEIEKNLQEAKTARNNEAQNIFAQDLDLGLPYPVDGSTYKVRVKTFDMASLLSIKNVISITEPTDGETFPFKFLDGYKEDFTRQEMITLIDEMTKAHYALLKNYWEYLDSVNTATTIPAIPELPSTFLQ